MNELIPIQSQLPTMTSDEIQSIGNKIREFYDKIELEPTPEEFIDKRPDGFDYVEIEYFRRRLNKEVLWWNWHYVNHEVIANKAVIYIGRLEYAIEIEGKIFVKNIVGCGGSVFQFSSSTGNILPPGNAIKSADADAFKKACNNGLGIANDVYRKDKAILISKVRNIIKHECFTEKQRTQSKAFLKQNDVTRDRIADYIIRLTSLIENYENNQEKDVRTQNEKLEEENV